MRMCLATVRPAKRLESVSCSASAIGEAADAKGGQNRRNLQPQSGQDDQQANNRDDDANEVLGERRRPDGRVEVRSVRADELDEHFRYQERQRRCGDDVQPSVEGVRNFRGQRPEPGGDVDADEHAPERHAPRDGAHHRLDPVAAGPAGKRGQPRGDNALRHLSNDICDGDRRGQRAPPFAPRPAIPGGPSSLGSDHMFFDRRSAMAGERRPRKSRC